MHSNDKKNEVAINGIIGQTYEVTAEGSLGLLALGAVGITAWRKKREEEKKKNSSKKENE